MSPVISDCGMRGLRPKYRFGRYGPHSIDCVSSAVTLAPRASWAMLEANVSSATRNQDRCICSRDVADHPRLGMENQRLIVVNTNMIMVV
jgi:hypothetical protein